MPTHSIPLDRVNLKVPTMKFRQGAKLVERPITDHPPIIQNTQWGAMATMNMLHPGSPLSPSAQVDGVTSLPKDGKQQMELMAEYIYKMFKGGVGCLALQEVPDPSSPNFKHLINKLKELDPDSKLINTNALASQWQKTAGHEFGTSLLYNPNVFDLSKKAKPVLGGRGASYELTHRSTGEKIPLANIHGDFEKQAQTTKFINNFNGICLGDTNVSPYTPNNQPQSIQTGEKPTVQIGGISRAARTFDVFVDKLSKKANPNFIPSTAGIVKSPTVPTSTFKPQTIQMNKALAKKQVDKFLEYLNQTKNHALIQNGRIIGLQLTTPPGSNQAQIRISNPHVSQAYERFKQSIKNDTALTSMTHSSGQLKTQGKTFTLKNPYGNNYVTSVDVLKEGYRINGLNSRGEPRSIIIDATGNPKGYHHSFLTPAEKQMFRERKAIFTHFNIDTTVSLNNKGLTAEQPKPMDRFILKNPYGDNYVTSVEVLDGGYKLNGINCRGEPRSLIIDKNGNLHGHSKGVLSIVEKQMFENKDKIIAHFHSQSTNNTLAVKNQQPNLPPQHPTVNFINKLSHHAAVLSVQSQGASNITQNYKAQIACISMQKEVIIQAASKMVQALKEPTNTNIKFSTDEIKALRAFPLGDCLKDFEKHHSLPPQYTRDEAQANTDIDKLNFSANLSNG